MPRRSPLSRMARRVGGRAWPHVDPGPTPPSPVDGATAGPPHFVGIGAQKAGTSWWHGLIATHPQVTSPPGVPKETHFFDPFWDRTFTEADTASYHALFPCTEGRVVGEWTPRYMHDFWVASLLRRAAPEARILVLLRDPVERYRSGLAHDLRRGAPGHPIVATDAFARGLYAAQLERFTAVFPREQVLVLQFEQCRRDAQGELDRTFAFLGLDPVLVPAKVRSRVVNATVEAKPPLPVAVEAMLRERYAEDGRRLAAAFPEIDVELWSRPAT